MTTYKAQFSTFNLLLAGGLIFTLIGLMIDVQTRKPSTSASQTFTGCAETINSEIFLSQEQLAQILMIPERDSKEKVREMLAEPYCVLPSVEVRSGIRAEREVYPLSFAPQAWLILLFEGDEYAGYRISIQH